LDQSAGTLAAILRDPELAKLCRMLLLIVGLQRIWLEGNGARAGLLAAKWRREKPKQAKGNHRGSFHRDSPFRVKREVELLHLVRAPSQKGSIRDRPSGRASLTLMFLTTPEGVLKIAEALTESTSSRMVGKQKTENLIR
jgi:hypothetical protein